MTGEQDPKAPALGFSITANITDRSQIVFQSYLPLDAQPQQIAETLDRVMHQVDRQQAKYQLKDFRRKLELEEIQLADQVAKVADLQNAYVNEHTASGRRGEFKLNAQQKAAVDNARKTIEGMKYNVERYRANLAELEALAK